MADSIHAALWKWFLQCGGITKLFFNFGAGEDESTVIATSGESVLQDYIDGRQLVRYSFDLIRYLPVAFQANDPGNVEMMEDVERIIEWVRRQNDAGNFPVFPSGSVESISVVEENAGFVAAQDEEIAKYMIPFAMDYLKEKG